jgi:hypothetical protein
MESKQRSLVDKVEQKIEEVANKNQSFLDSGKIVPLSAEWPFSTNGLYLLIASQGCGKSRFIIKHIFMTDTINDGNPYYSLICYYSTSGEMDRTVQSYLESGITKTPLVQVPDTELLDFLNKHLHRKKKYYSMIEYLQRKVITPKLQHSIDKHYIVGPTRTALRDVHVSAFALTYVIKLLQISSNRRFENIVEGLARKDRGHIVIILHSM